MIAMNLASILAFITNRTVARTAAELRAALAEIDQAALERRVDELEAQRRKLLLTGTDAEVQALLKDLSAANLEAERGEAASEELKRQIAAAEAREHAAEIEKLGARAKAQEIQLVGAYVELDELAGRVVELLGDVETGRENLRQLNITLKSSNRPELQGRFPEHLLSELLDGVNSASLPAPLSWHLPGYYPISSRSARDKTRPLARLRELLPAGHAIRKSS